MKTEEGTRYTRLWRSTGGDWSQQVEPVRTKIISHSFSPVQAERLFVVFDEQTFLAPCVGALPSIVHSTDVDATGGLDR